MFCHTSVRALWRPAIACIIGSGTVRKLSHADFDPECQVNFESDEKLLNWSSTHSTNVCKLYEPHDDIEVMRLLQHHSEKKKKLRPVGTALSPNGLGMPNDGTDGLSLRHMNSICINKEQATVTVGAGATVADLLSTLSAQGMTLENFSSIQEQQLGGWTQVAAHGTGILLPTVEEQIIEMKLLTPAHGSITLSATKNPSLFNMAKVGLGSLGVVTELTLRCIPKLRLTEVTKVFNRQSITAADEGSENNSAHFNRLVANRHVRYMWLPYTDTVVSVTSKKAKEDDFGCSIASTEASSSSASAAAKKEMVDLLVQSARKSGAEIDPATVQSTSVAGLRDMLLEFGPLDSSHIREINRAESGYWSGTQNTRTEDSVDILGFDCGGEQWVLEVCVPLGHLHADNQTDIHFVKELLNAIEAAQLPAASPIEQRWTARSSAPMSPAFSSDPQDKFSWVGVIMYVPSTLDQDGREKVRKAFVNYCCVVDPVLKKYKAQVHWAKIELPDDRDYSARTSRLENASGNQHSRYEDNTNSWGESRGQSLRRMRGRIQEKYPVEEFSELKRVLDPEGILSNKIVDSLFD